MNGACKDSSCSVGIAQASVTGCKDVSINSEKTNVNSGTEAGSIIAAGTEKNALVITGLFAPGSVDPS